MTVKHLPCTDAASSWGINLLFLDLTWDGSGNRVASYQGILHFRKRQGLFPFGQQMQQKN